MSDRTTQAGTTAATPPAPPARAEARTPEAGEKPAGQGSLPAEASRGEGDPEVELVRKAAAILGTEQMVRWMKMSILSLNHRTPLSLMATAEGREQVEQALGRIEHGVF